MHEENSQFPPSMLVVAGQHADHRQDVERCLPLSLGYRRVENDALCHQRFILWNMAKGQGVQSALGSVIATV